jgi:UDP-glucose 4-epimerase
LDGVLAGKRVLVTGGTGSLGRALVGRLLAAGEGAPEKLIVLSRDEAKQHAMRVAHLRAEAATDDAIAGQFARTLEFRLGDVRDPGDVVSALRDCDVVIHAAALKQVPACEYFPDQALLTNGLGAANITRAIREHDLPVETVLAISTDKACKPVNAMGMTKALQERIVIAANVLNPATRFCVVRYGNVLASRGSVAPLFLDQIANGGPVTVTDPAMTRFLLSLDTAVDSILATLAHARRGEIFVPRAPGVRIMDLARAMIGGRDIPILVTGARPGEKLDETLIGEEEVARTTGRGGHHVIRPMLPELADPVADAAPRTLSAPFLSSDGVLDAAGVRALLAANGLAPP